VASISYIDLKRYLQVTNRLDEETENYFTIKNSNLVFIPSTKNSLFENLVPVDSDILEKINDANAIYAVTHSTGDILITKLNKLKKYLETEVTDGNYLIPIEEFKNIKDVIKNPDAGKVIHIHAHSTFSSSDGMSLPEISARRCKQLDMPSCGISDHGTLSGIIDHFKACKKYGIKPLIGQEFYLDDDRFQKGAPKDIREKNKKNKEAVKVWEKEHRINLRRHLCLFAKNEIGLKNLYRLSSLAFIEGFYYRPRIDWELLEKYSDGLILTTGCAAGIISGETKKEYKIRNLKRILKIFGKENIYLETMLIQHEPQPKLNDEIFYIAEKTGLKVICGMDSHYVDPDINHVHQYYMKIGSGYSYGEGDNYLATYSEIKNSYEKYFSDCKYGWKYYDQALKNSFELADKCNVEIELGKFKIPVFNLKTAIVPALENETDIEYFKRRAIDGFKKKIIGKIPKEKIPEYKERFKYELKTFIECGYVNYMLIVLDEIDYAKSIGMIPLVRGSAAAGLTCMCLEMTRVDPIKLDLLFERFVSPLRAGLVDKSYASPPDIDCDFPDRDKIIEYMTNKYGKDNVARIGTCNRAQIKKAIKDMAEVTGFMKFQDANKITRLIPTASKTLEEALEIPAFKEWYDIKENKKWISTFVEPILGLAGHHGIHAAGIVIAPGKLIDYLPIKVQEKKKEDAKSQEKERLTVTQFEGDSVEAIGLLKFDVLRVRTLAHIKTTLDLIKSRTGKKINLDKLNLDDPKYYKGFKKGNVQGVFQLDTKATSDLLSHFMPKNFMDIMILISLSRPGTAGPGLDMEYCERRNGKSFEYDHPLLKPILEETLGIPIFQSHMMKMVNQIGGLSLVEADKFRKICKKKDVSQMASYREKFIKGAKKKGLKSRKEILNIWDKIISWSKYGFARPHAAAYAQLSVWTMVLKTYYPLEFYAGWLENPKNKDQLVLIYRDLKKHKIPVVLPNVNKSKTNYTIQDKKIIWALKGIKYIGDEPAQIIAENAPYKNMEDFIKRTKSRKINKRVVDALISIEAFPWYDHPREAANDYYRIRKESVPVQFDINDKKIWNKSFYQYTGFYKYDPFLIYEKDLEPYGGVDTYEEFIDLTLGEGAKVAGYITDFKEINAKNGLMCVLKIHSYTETIPIVVWNSFYESSDLRRIKKEDLIGAFVFIFGEKNYGLNGEDQVNVGESESIIKIFE